MRVMGQKIPKLPLVRADVRPRLPTLFFSLEWVLIKRNSKGAQMRSRNDNIGAKREPVLRHQKTIEKACEFRGFFRTERGHKLIEFRFGYVQKHL